MSFKHRDTRATIYENSSWGKIRQTYSHVRPSILLTIPLLPWISYPHTLTLHPESNSRSSKKCVIYRQPPHACQLYRRAHLLGGRFNMAAIALRSPESGLASRSLAPALLRASFCALTSHGFTRPTCIHHNSRVCLQEGHL